MLFLQSRGEPLIHIGHGNYKHKEHDSLQIQGNHYTWFSRDGGTRNQSEDGRNAITFCMEFYGWSFQKAVEELTGFVPDHTADYATRTTYEPQRAVESLSGRVYEQSPKRVIAYLNQRRGIDYELIRQLLKAGQLRQDQRGNCCFTVKDWNGKHVCDMLRGTATPRPQDKDFRAFKGEVGTQGDFGFCYGNDLNPRYIIFFEAPIDLLSFVQLVKAHALTELAHGMRYGNGNVFDIDKPFDTALLGSCLFVAMGGRKDGVCRNYMQHYDKATAVIAVDNDKAGKEFRDKLCDDKATRRELRIVGYIVPTAKDWNELLMQG